MHETFNVAAESPIPDDMLLAEGGSGSGGGAVHDRADPPAGAGAPSGGAGHLRGDGCLPRRLPRVSDFPPVRHVLAVARRLARRAIELAAVALCIARAVGRPRDRLVPLVMAPALVSWWAGDLVMTFESLGRATPPTHSLTNVFYLAFPPLAVAAAGGCWS